MNCHMHQPNMFMNTYLGYTMWDYESDAPRMWPEKQKYPTAAEMHETLERNPEGAAVRGKWADPEFLKTFFSSITRRLFGTAGVDPDVEFFALDLDPLERCSAADCRPASIPA